MADKTEISCFKKKIWPVLVVGKTKEYNMVRVLINIIKINKYLSFIIC